MRFIATVVTPEGWGAEEHPTLRRQFIVGPNRSGPVGHGAGLLRAEPATAKAGGSSFGVPPAFAGMTG
jgi:hypothetical protein